MIGAGLSLIVVVGVTALSVPQLTAAAGARPARQPTPGASDSATRDKALQKLWRTYPLRPKAKGTARHSPPLARTETGPQLRNRNSRGQNWLWILVGAVLTLFAAAAIVVTLLSNFRYRGGHMDKFRLTGSRDRHAKKDEDEGQDEPTAEERLDAGARVARYLGTAPDRSADSEQLRPIGNDFDRLGGHVSSVLTAAEEAAVRIQEEARQEAERVREQAETEAVARAEAVREDADATRAEAERLRSEAERWTKQTRAAAEKYAAERRAEVEIEARKILTAAELQAASFSKEAERRQQALKMDISLAEDRLRQLASGLHDLAARLDKLLSTPFAETEQSDLVAGANDSLMNALEPSRETEEITR
jgi:hypothetical protein